ncbi:MAG TPA: hypothetical protein VLH18_01005 [Candidatus Limnocylindrales bacterium]|nr:hypothetical protein [Candidatus Limnocylindrales bacterium]
MEENLLTVFTTSNLILAALGVYLVVIVILGLIYARKIHDQDDLVVAGRQLNIFFLVPSIIATWICAGAMMGAAGWAYLYGMQGVIFDPWAPALGMVLVAFFFAYRMRKAKYLTVTDFFDTRYGTRMGFLYTIIQILSAMAWQAGQLVALGIIVSLTTGFSLSFAIVIATVAIIIVTTTGGLWALSRVDAIGFVLIVLGLLMLFPTVMGEVGGISNFFATAQNWAELPTWAMTPVAGDQGYLWYTGILGILLYISAWAALSLGDVQSQVLMQRALAAKDEKTAVAGFFASGVLYLILGLMPVMIGIAVFTWGLETTEAQAEFVLPWAAYTFLPDWAGALFIVTIAAAIVSTAGNNSLVMATLIGHNIYRHIKPEATSAEILKITRIFVIVATLITMAIGLYFEVIYKLIIFSGGIQLGTVFAAYAFGHFWKKANNTGAITSFFVGIVSWLSGYAYIHYAMEVYAGDAIFMSLVPAAAISIITLIVVSLATQKQDPPKPMLSFDGKNIEKEPMFFWSKKT